MKTDAQAERELQAHRQFGLGDTVRSLVRYRKGQEGTIVERLDDRFDGLARYGVRMPERFAHGGAVTADFSRTELRLVKRAPKAKKRALREKLEKRSGRAR